MGEASSLSTPAVPGGGFCSFHLGLFLGPFSFAGNMLDFTDIHLISPDLGLVLTVLPTMFSDFGPSFSRIFPELRAMASGGAASRR